MREYQKYIYKAIIIGEFLFFYHDKRLFGYYFSKKYGEESILKEIYQTNVSILWP